jgi:hypothetical protein
MVPSIRRLEVTSTNATAFSQRDLLQWVSRDLESALCGVKPSKSVLRLITQFMKCLKCLRAR